MAAASSDDILLRLHPEDNVGVLRRTAKAGVELHDDAGCLTLSRTVPGGHKVAIRSIEEGAPIRKYGQIIGFAKAPIARGEHVHTHNVVMKDFGRDYEFCVDAQPVAFFPPEQTRHFQGYTRPNGRVGTRNYLAVISSVNCSASVSDYVAERFRTAEFKRDFPNVDGVIAFTHKSGCGIQPGAPLKLLQRVLAGIARHPNISGYVMIGLGCEVNQAQHLAKDFNLDQPAPGELVPTIMTIQNTGGIRKTVEAGVAAVQKLLPAANEMRRTQHPLSKLVLALNCGGSDGNSGITANPALGVASDELVRFGGTSVLAETPEIYGAEHLLTRRAVNRDVGEKLVRMIHWWEDYVRLHNASIDNNPSYGNKEGGLTTIYEKSLGAVAKGGQSPLAAVYDYAEPITAPGFSFMDTPGYDPVSMTGLVCGGCNVGVFTTGRGSVYGCKPSPCIKVATNTPLYEHMEEDMDINAGTILDGTETVQQVGMRILEKIVSVANGEKTKSELAGIGDEEFAPWILGPNLLVNKFYDPGEARSQKVRELFTRIAPRYDLINDLQSLGLHRVWKRTVVRLANVRAGEYGLDVCCGSGDLTLAFEGRGVTAVGLDFTAAMLKCAGDRGARCLVQGDAQALPFPDDIFNVVTVGYGLRNLSNWQKGLEEMCRVARSGGRVIVLDFGKPENAMWRALYFGYLRLAVPMFGRVFCGDAAAYAYILESLRHYPAQRGVAEKMTQMNCADVRTVNLLGGAMSINYCVKR